jgi:hypothetical protein
MPSASLDGLFVEVWEILACKSIIGSLLMGFLRTNYWSEFTLLYKLLFNQDKNGQTIDICISIIINTIHRSPCKMGLLGCRWINTYPQSGNKPYPRWVFMLPIYAMLLTP